MGQREMIYEDCAKLPYLTKCCMETLRLWTAVPNGTFRELQFDDEVRGPGGEMVTLKKGKKRKHIFGYFCTMASSFP